MTAEEALRVVLGQIALERCPRIGHTQCLGVIEQEEGVSVTKAMRGSPLCVYRTAQLRLIEEIQRRMAT